MLGTLTENRMTVVEGWFSGVKYAHAPRADELRDEVRQELIMNICLNSKAFLIEEEAQTQFVGNRTECALLVLAKKWGADYHAIREQYSDKVEKVRIGGALWLDRLYLFYDTPDYFFTRYAL